MCKYDTKQTARVLCCQQVDPLTAGRFSQKDVTSVTFVLKYWVRLVLHPFQLVQGYKFAHLPQYEHKALANEGPCLSDP